MKVFVECCKSKDKDSLYHTLKVDFGYRVGILTMDKDVIIEMANMTYAQLYSMKAGEVIHLGDMIIKGVK